MTSEQPAWGIGLSTSTAEGQVLDAWFPADNLGLGARPSGEPAALLGAAAGAVGERALPGLRAEIVVVELGSLADPIKDAADAYLRLHLLSHRIVRPNELNLDGIFGMLANVAWTSAGPCPPDRVDELRVRERLAGRQLTVYGIDKFPRMTDYVVPAGVRIADADRVRLGAHLASGTTVMHEGFVNFNAGTLGTSMVEGRIVAGVVVGDGSDIGGGASILGTLSGGGKDKLRIGERCLLGANAGIGISLGDDCVVEAGCYITAGSKITLPDGRVVKARELAGLPNLLFWRNSVTGALEARPRAGSGIELNAALHAND
ncbi:2,3,4,5-tetrahydropyridine-2-carboxylate N-succinyltransferase [Asanoa ishikariensis]|uniref:2,3,4,5-tetrahydropyridine-2,6-dicarboxylate N-succinyltransferase n=1 Tax=Asanoa ishikariensis TaxID=137265 RepID=A0A1H3QWT3_9ACTN|nr:2,3,4,5-tetrahydropyridine-2,6-dicarboxylate N-succinyltransferase [Asanoa ishikariensis]SDZ17907.1 2,3,4,5-tetrahydropyridine-2-carboxylate N-succinyltransferase [Asanoa ishikariensis]